MDIRKYLDISWDRVVDVAVITALTLGIYFGALAYERHVKKAPKYRSEAVEICQRNPADSLLYKWEH